MKQKGTIGMSIFISICLLALIYNNYDNLHRLYIVLFNKSGVLISYKDGKMDGDLIKYVDGKVHLKVNFKNSLREGWATQYYNNGRIENKIFYKDNKAQGIEYEYYSNGQLNYSRCWKDGKQYGNLLKYFTDGKLDTYAVFDIMGRNFYDHHYDRTGKLVKMEGYVTSSFIYSLDEKNDSTIVLNYYAYHHNNRFDGIRDLYITVATPPNLILKLQVDINHQIFKNLKVVNNTIRIPNAFSIKGTYHIFITSNLVDKSDNIVDGINNKTTIIKE
ncbi:MAG TPA: hypothetical protein VFE53_01235 [Mucilaginibacter sp.]|nr:hypothetical protein [Mucilaginibacter sp.]